MCKVGMIAGVKKENIEKVLQFTYHLGKEITTGNNDGLGYAAIDSSGNTFGERWLNNNQAWMRPEDLDLSEGEKKLVQAFPDVLDIEKPKMEYTSFGNINLDDMVAITLHTRYATSAKGIMNTHPFVHEDTTLIHNGVIHNCNSIGMPTSTCDSEAILTSYMKNNISDNIAKVQTLANELDGYYVAALLTTNEDGVPVMDIIKGNNPRLDVVFIKELGVFVFSSSGLDIEAACRKMGLTMDTVPKNISGDIAIRLDAISGNMIKAVRFNASAVKHVTPRYQGAKHYIPSKTYTGMHDYTGAAPSLRMMSEAEVANYRSRYDD
jgi:hypothetical protein